MWSSVWPMAASEIRVPIHGSTTKLAIQTTIPHRAPSRTGGLRSNLIDHPLHTAIEILVRVRQLTHLTAR